MKNPDFTKSRALRILKYIRRGTKEIEGFVNIMKECLWSENISLADIGTSEEELSQLRLKSHRICALDYFNTLRLGATRPDMEVLLLRRHLIAAGLTLEDIGTTEEELLVFSERIDIISP